MGEFIGLAYYAEVPGVIFDVQRTGPSTGLPTRTMQGDVMKAAYASHGDCKHPCLYPNGLVEAYEFAIDAFDLAERLQTIGLRPERPRPRHEPVDVRPVPVPREAHRARQGARRRRRRRDEGLGPLQGRGRRRHPVPHAPGHARRRQGRLLHARLRPRRERPLHRSGPRSTCATWTASRASSRPRKGMVPAPVLDGLRREGRHPRVRHHPLGRRRGARPAARRAQARHRLPAACGPSRSRRRSGSSSRATTACTWSSRTATRQMLGMLRMDYPELDHEDALGAALQRAPRRRPQPYGRDRRLRSRPPRPRRTEPASP